ncbi:MAG: SDR family oxidoreductase [Chloroflexota bacterium]|nr:SDR family oxidoreductase [Chloroflexota bacterium]
MQGKVCLITGATNGIGKVAALELAKKGATVIVAGRDSQKTEQVVSAIRQAAGHERVHHALADLSLMSGVHALADDILKRYDRLDVLLNNAGGIFNERHVTSEGLELTFALNHMSYFLLTHRLLDLLCESAPARVINVSSNAHFGVQKLDFDNLQGEKSYFGFGAYSRSKLANVLFTYELARRLVGTGVTANALHPGAVSTGFGMNNKDVISKVLFTLFKMMTITPEQGAQTSIYLASSPEVNGMTGKYFTKSKPATSSAASYDEESQHRLWQVSEQIAGISVSAAAHG